MHRRSISTIQEDCLSNSTKYKTRFRRWVRLIIKPIVTDTLGNMSSRDSFEDKNLVRWDRETVKKSGFYVGRVEFYHQYNKTLICWMEKLQFLSTTAPV